jgi:hypothetical protein
MTVAESTSRPVPNRLSHLCSDVSATMLHGVFGTSICVVRRTVCDVMSFNSENTVHTRVRKNKNFLVAADGVHRTRHLRTVGWRRTRNDLDVRSGVRSDVLLDGSHW